MHGDPYEAAVAQNDPLRGALRLYLLFTAAVAGSAVLIVEILGAKMLAPYMGTSHFVWTAQIAVTLLSLAMGYWLGGALADRSPDLHRLYVCVLSAGLYLSITVVSTERVAYACFRFPLSVGSIVASFFLFFVPLTLLATVVPFLIRALSASLDGLGRLAGKLSAISTIGSVAGTLLIGHVFVPLFPNSLTMLLLSGSLSLLSICYFVFFARSRIHIATTCIAAAIATLIAAEAVRAESRRQPRNNRELFRQNTPFGELRVWQNITSNVRFYATDLVVQNEYDPARKQSIDTFTYALPGLAALYRRQLRDVLCIGMGIGSIATRFAHAGARVDVMEINPVVPEVAARFFDFEPAHANVVIGDGRQLLVASRKQYDVVILDAFLGETPPLHLMTSEVFALVKEHLKPGGLLVVNAFGNPDDGRGFTVASLYRTMRTRFSNARVHHAGGPNTFLLASDAPLVPVAPPDFSDIHPFALATYKHAIEHQLSFSLTEGMVLRDDYNPADYYDAANHERERRVSAVRLRGVERP